MKITPEQVEWCVAELPANTDPELRKELRHVLTAMANPDIGDEVTEMMRLAVKAGGWEEMKWAIDPSESRGVQAVDRRPPGPTGEGKSDAGRRPPGPAGTVASSTARLFGTFVGVNPVNGDFQDRVRIAAQHLGLLRLSPLARGENTNDTEMLDRVVAEYVDRFHVVSPSDFNLDAVNEADPVLNEVLDSWAGGHADDFAWHGRSLTAR
jgi:hypothetical protein